MSLEWLALWGVLCLVVTLFLSRELLYIYRKRKLKSVEGDLYFESHRGPIFYTRQGRGPALLLIHGLGASSYCWRKNIQELQKSYQVIAPDLWGFGKSSKEQIKDMSLDDHAQILLELMESLNIKKFHVLGHSMGGHIALWLAKVASDRVERLVAIAPASHPRVAPVALRKLAWLAHWTPLVVNRRVIRRALKREIKDDQLITESMIDGYLAPYLDPQSHHAFASAIGVINDRRVFNALETIEVPILLLLGEQDQVVRLKTMMQINKKLPNSALHTHPRSKHMPMEDSPEWINGEVFAFLKSGQD